MDIGYLKKEKLDEVAEYFLKSSPHLTECYQMFKAKKNFNTRVNGCNLEDLFELFGTLCTMSKFCKYLMSYHYFVHDKNFTKIIC